LHCNRLPLLELPDGCNCAGGDGAEVGAGGAGAGGAGSGGSGNAGKVSAGIPDHSS